ncbi:MAG: hypothetical protein GC204_21290 [Chloroflexi bacterium]|nr:hypothetical protein [Chloroflexota bacterium]
MTYLKEKNDFINEIIDHIRQKIEVLDSDTSVEVKILLSKPLRNDNPSVRVMFTNPQIMAEAAFWSEKTYEKGEYRVTENEVILGDGGYFETLDDVDRMIEQLVTLFISNPL